MNWRDTLDPQLKPLLDSLANEVSEHKDCYLEAENPGGAQLWVAMSILEKQILDLNSKIKILEKALADKKPKKNNNEDPSKILKDVLKKL